MDQIPGVTPTDVPAEPQEQAQPPADLPAQPQPSGFGSRGRVRRRARFLRKARELAYRDLGGLVYNLHRFGARNDELVLAKLTTVGQIDAELRTLEGALGEREPVTVLREAGINACPRCAAIHSSEDRFCPNCGLSMGRHADLPIAGAPTPAAPAASAPVPPAAAPPAAAPPAATPVPPAAAPTPAATQAPPATATPAAPASPAAPAPPVTQTAVPAPARPVEAVAEPPAPSPDTTTGRAPAPPTSSGPDQPTEIIRPEPSAS